MTFNQSYVDLLSKNNVTSPQFRNRFDVTVELGLVPELIEGMELSDSQREDRNEGDPRISRDLLSDEFKSPPYEDRLITGPRPEEILSFVVPTEAKWKSKLTDVETINMAEQFYISYVMSCFYNPPLIELLLELVVDSAMIDNEQRKEGRDEMLNATLKTVPQTESDDKKIDNIEQLRNFNSVIGDYLGYEAHRYIFVIDEDDRIVTDVILDRVYDNIKLGYDLRKMDEAFIDSYYSIINDDIDARADFIQDFRQNITAFSQLVKKDTTELDNEMENMKLNYGLHINVPFITKILSVDEEDRNIAINDKVLHLICYNYTTSIFVKNNILVFNIKKS